MHSEREVCPTVWETGEPSAVCLQINYVTLSQPPDVSQRAGGWAGGGWGATRR
jgi:hypothetical protein